MKTIKRVFALLMCVCMLTGTFVLTGAAEDKKQIELNRPAVTVTQSEQLKVFELKLDFFPDGADPAACAFTDFDKDAKITMDVVFLPYSEKGSLTFQRYIVKPTAFDAADGVLTAELCDRKEGKPGVALFMPQAKTVDCKSEDMREFQTVINKNFFGHSMFGFRFSFPEGMLYAADAASAAGTPMIRADEVNAIPVYERVVFSKLFIRTVGALNDKWIEMRDTHKYSVVTQLIAAILGFLCVGPDPTDPNNWGIDEEMSLHKLIVLAVGVPVMLPTLIRSYILLSKSVRQYMM